MNKLSRLMSSKWTVLILRIKAGITMLKSRAVSSVGQSACLTSRMSPVRVWDRPPFYKPLSNQGLHFFAGEVAS